MKQGQILLREQVKKLLDSQYLAVLATSERTSPHLSLVTFISSHDIRYIYFATSRNTRKFKNIERQAHVSLLVDDRRNSLQDFEDSSTVTALGTAKTVNAGEKDSLSVFFTDKFPPLRDFIHDRESEIIRIMVTEYILVRRFQDLYSLKMR